VQDKNREINTLRREEGYGGKDLEKRWVLRREWKTPWDTPTTDLGAESERTPFHASTLRPVSWAGPLRNPRVVVFHYGQLVFFLGFFVVPHFFLLVIPCLVYSFTASNIFISPVRQNTTVHNQGIQYCRATAQIFASEKTKSSRGLSKRRN